jgi:ubiquinone/menaquinone biosynthesis C-methylase UbiE
MRLGSYYRNLIWMKIGIQAKGDKVLDVGGFDGYWLSKQPTKIKICADIEPKEKYGNVIYIRANALYLPFPDGYFEQVFAFDVIEHVDDERKLLQELNRVIKPDGQIVISTPHKHISIFPPFITSWISRRWGHYRVKGYLEYELRNIIPESDVVEFLLTRELFFRTFYLPLRLLWGLNGWLAKPAVKIIAYFDTIFINGENGHVVMCISRGS